MSIDTKTLRLAEATYRDRAHHATADLLRDAAGTINAQAADNKRLREALDSIRQYGADTLSGRADGPDDRAWQREAVREMTKRARAALQESPHDR